MSLTVQSNFEWPVNKNQKSVRRQGHPSPKVCPDSKFRQLKANERALE